ncbi:hypothetical protein MK079_05575 [Candidatus Gracilibacteria bacterium]|nr:hypothetical protein [Candidatus Gracilibacteria bacterium]
MRRGGGEETISISMKLLKPKDGEENTMGKYHDYSPYLRILKLHIRPEVDEQTMIFINIQAFLLPEDEVTEKFILFVVTHPYWRKVITILLGEGLSIFLRIFSGENIMNALITVASCFDRI